MFEYGNFRQRGGGGGGVFRHSHNCFSVAMAGKSHLEDGDKILLPNSALEKLSAMNVEYPLLFRLLNKSTGKFTHCGVLEFTADEGRCYIPHWMMQNLLVQEAGIIEVSYQPLSKATFVKFRPQSVDFLDITNPRVVLEKSLRKYSCLTVGDHICFQYLHQTYFLEVCEVKPNNAACIIETDVNLDFEAPVGYVEPARPPPPPSKTDEKAAASAASVFRGPLQKASTEAASEAEEFKPFAGSAQRIDGKQVAGAATVTAAATGGAAAQVVGASPGGGPGGGPAGVGVGGVMPRQSLLGSNNFSKKKAATTVFGGAGQSLGGNASK